MWRVRHTSHSPCLHHVMLTSSCASHGASIANDSKISIQQNGSQSGSSYASGCTLQEMSTNKNLHLCDARTKSKSLTISKFALLQVHLITNFTC